VHLRKEKLPVKCKMKVHRIRYVMAHPAFKGMLKGTVEVDETDIGGKRRVERKGNVEGKRLFYKEKSK